MAIFPEKYLPLAGKQKAGFFLKVVRGLSPN